MPLALALCDALQPKLRAVSALGVVIALLFVSNPLSAALFVPLMAGYAIASARSARLSLSRCIGAVLAAFVLGMGIAAAYALPLIAYRHLFDTNSLPVLMPNFELGRWFSFITADTLSRRFFVPATAVTSYILVIVARAIWRAGGNLASRLAMAITLGLGIVMLTPDAGPVLIRLSGLSVSSFDTPGDFSARILFTALSSIGLGLLGYSWVAKVATLREQVLLAGACGAFLFMLPWSAPIWKLIPQLAALQFPFRFCGILSVSVGGLFAIAMDKCIQER